MAKAVAEATPVAEAQPTQQVSIGSTMSIPAANQFVGATPGWDMESVNETVGNMDEQRAALLRPRAYGGEKKAPVEKIALENSSEGVSIPQEEKEAKISTGDVAKGIPDAQVNDYVVNEEDISQIQDPIIKSMALMFRNVAKGADLDRALGNAIRYADSRLVDSAYLREIGGENANDLIEMAKGIVEGVIQQARSFEQSVYAEAGGEKQWYQAVNIFNSKAPEELRVTIANMIDSRDEKLIRAATRMVVNFNNNSGFAPVVKPTLAHTAVTQAQQGLSEAEFDKALRGLNMFDKNFAQQRNELIRQRLIGKQAGR